MTYQGYPRYELGATEPLPLDINLHHKLEASRWGDVPVHTVDYEPTIGLEPTQTVLGNETTVFETGTKDEPLKIGDIQIDDQTFGVVARIHVKPSRARAFGVGPSLSELLVIDMRQCAEDVAVTNVGPFNYDGHTTVAGSGNEANWTSDFAVVNVSKVLGGHTFSAIHRVSRDRTKRTILAPGITGEVDIFQWSGGSKPRMTIASGHRGNLVLEGEGIDSNEFTILTAEASDPNAKKGFSIIDPPAPKPAETPPKPKDQPRRSSLLQPNGKISLFDMLDDNVDPYALAGELIVRGLSNLASSRQFHILDKPVERHPVVLEIERRLADGEPAKSIKRDMAKRFSNGGSGATGGSDTESFKVMTAMLAEHDKNSRTQN